MEVIENFIKNSIIPFDEQLKKQYSFSFEQEMTDDEACPMRQLIMLIRFIEKCKFPVITTTNPFSEILQYNNEFAKELAFLSMCNANIKLNIYQKYKYCPYKEIFKFDQPKKLIYNPFYKIDKINEALRASSLTYMFNTNDLIIAYDKRTPNSKTLILALNRIIITDKVNFKYYESLIS